MRHSQKQGPSSAAQIRQTTRFARFSASCRCKTSRFAMFSGPHIGQTPRFAMLSARRLTKHARFARSAAVSGWALGVPGGPRRLARTLWLLARTLLLQCWPGLHRPPHGCRVRAARAQIRRKMRCFLPRAFAKRYVSQGFLGAAVAKHRVSRCSLTRAFAKLLRGDALGADFVVFAAFLPFLACGAFLACPAYRLARSLSIRVW